MLEALRLFPGRLPLLPTGDSTVFMNDARRLLEGEAIYRDFFQFTTPGAPVVYWALFRAFGVRAWVEDAVMLASAVALVWLTLEISARVLHGWGVIVPPLVTAGVTFRYYHDATHHWLSAVSIASAVCVLAAGRGALRLIAAGALCGATAFITQNKAVGLAVGIGAFLVWESWPDWRAGLRRASIVGAAAACAFAILMAPFVAQSGVRIVYEDIVTFPIKHYSGVYANSWQSVMADWPDGFGARLGYMVTYASVPLALVASMLALSRGKKVGEENMALVLVTFAGLGLFVSAMPAANGYRIASVGFLGLIAGARLLESSGTAGRFALAGVALVAVVGLLTPVGSSMRVVELPVGRVAVPSSPMGDAIIWARQNTVKGEAFVGNPVLGFAMQYEMPGAVLYPSAGRYTDSQQYERLIAWSERRRPRFIVLHPSAFLVVYPTQGGDSSSAFREFLIKQYASKGYVGDEEVFRRRDDSQRAQSTTLDARPEGVFPQ